MPDCKNIFKSRSMQKENYKIISINQKYMLAACVRTSDYILTMGILTGQLCL
jgi:hypothetical protein